MLVLNDLKPGETGVVSDILSKGNLKHRLVDMGITPGVDVTVKRVAPFGDPISIRLRGYDLSIRRSEAKCIAVLRMGGDDNR